MEADVISEAADARSLLDLARLEDGSRIKRGDMPKLIQMGPGVCHVMCHGQHLRFFDIDTVVTWWKSNTHTHTY